MLLAQEEAESARICLLLASALHSSLLSGIQLCLTAQFVIGESMNAVVRGVDAFSWNDCMSTAHVNFFPTEPNGENEEDYANGWACRDFTAQRMTCGTTPCACTAVKPRNAHTFQ